LENTIRFSFFPYNWHNSDDVQINHYQKVNSQGGGLRRAVNSESLKQDPQSSPTQRAVDNWDSPRFLRGFNASAEFHFRAFIASRPVATNASR
jgi:hypothetical protein